MNNYLNKLYTFVISIYWSIFKIPMVVDLLFDENYTKLDWEKYFLFNKKYLKQGYKKYSRERLLLNCDYDDTLTEIINDLSIDTFKKYNYENINLWEVCKASILSDLNKNESGIINGNDIVIIKLYFVEAIKYMIAIENLLQQENIAALLISQGTTFASRAIFEIAQRKGITTVALENSFVSDRFYADNSCGMILNRHAIGSSVWYRTKARVLTDKQRAELLEKINSLYLNKNPEHATNDQLGMQEIYEEFNIQKDKKIAVILAQVMTDASVVMDSDIFPDPIFFIEKVIKFFNRTNNWFLLIRLHPYEAHGVRNSSLNGRYKNLDNPTSRELKKIGFNGNDKYCIIEGTEYSTKSIIEKSDLGITLNSQAGLEMLMLNRPVVTAGMPFYANKGFTYDVTCQETLDVVLSTAIQRPYLTDRQREEIEKFSYTLLFEYSFPKDLSKLDYKFDDLFRVRQGYTGLINNRCI